MRQLEKIDEDSVRKGIIDSFEKNKYPGDSRLVELHPDDDWDSQEIFQRLQNKSWQDLLSHLEKINGPELYWYSSIYTMLTPDSFYYYIPTFLIIAMDLYRTDVVGTDFVYLLSKSASDDHLKYFIIKVTELLSDQQRMAIQKWVRYLLQEYPEWTQVNELQHWL